jgi:glycosyltransferase involved in cell wall biosynthesis
VRIAHVVPRGEQPSSGVLTVVSDLSRTLAERGHQVELWQLHDWAPDRYADVRARFEPAGVEEVPALAGVPLHRLGRAADHLARERSPDVVHLHGGFNPSNTAVVRRLSVPYVFSPHSAYDAESLRRSRVRKLVYRTLFERRMLRRASHVVALTDVEAADVAAFVPGVGTTVIRNGVRPAPAGIDRDVFRRELGLRANDPLAVFVGRLDVARKGLDRLVDGVAAAPDWTAALIGPEFRGVPELVRRIGELGVGERVRFIGERHGLPLWSALAGADVFVLASRWEGLPMALLEALSVGTPAIVSPPVERAVGVAAAGAGWVADGGIGDALASIGSAPAAELAGRRRAALDLAARYDWAAVGSALERVYEGAARSREPVAR